LSCQTDDMEPLCGGE